MLRSSLFAASAVLLSTAAAAQPTQQVLTQKTVVTRGTKNLGTYHVATGTWTRPGRTGQANIVQGDLGSIYDNTCLPGNGMVSGVIQLTATEVQADTGEIPSVSNDGLNGMSTLVNKSDVYTVEGWRWGVCPDEPAGAGLTMTATMFFFERMNACTSGQAPLLATAPISQAIAVGGIPTSSTAPCYLFNVDIENTSLEFDINGDADMVHGAPGLEGQAGDTFGIGFTLTRSDNAAFAGAQNAFSLGGNKFGLPGNTCQGSFGFVAQSTRFLPNLVNIDTATGYGQLDVMQAFDPAAANPNACFFFGHTQGNGGPWAGFYAEVYGSPSGSPPVVFNEFCFGDGGVTATCTPCPCGNNSAPGTQAGCQNHDARSADLNVSGVPSATNDTLRFTMTGGTTSTFGVLIAGTVVLPNNMSNPCFGLNSGIQSGILDGLRCAGGTTQRFGSRSANAMGEIGTGVAGPGNNGWGPPSGPAGGLIAFGALPVGQTRFFQVFYRTTPTLGCMTGQNTSQAIQVNVTM